MGWGDEAVEKPLDEDGNLIFDPSDPVRDSKALTRYAEKNKGLIDDVEVILPYR